jgi:hypothetical protein
MVGLMAMIAIMMILTTATFPAWNDVVRRDDEAEMIFRAREICRGLQRYQRDRGTLPTKLDQLMEPGSRGQYFMRRLYTDPLVKGGKWGLLFLAPGGGIYDPNGEQGAGGVDAMGNPIVAPASPFGGQQQGAGGSKLQNLGNPQAGAQPGMAGQGGTKPGQAFGGGAFGGEGETGLPIAGVRTLCPDKPFRIFRDQEDYSKWLFTFNDQDLQPPPLPGAGPNPFPKNPNQNPGITPGNPAGMPGTPMNPGGNKNPK